MTHARKHAKCHCLEAQTTCRTAIRYGVSSESFLDRLPGYLALVCFSDFEWSVSSIRCFTNLRDYCGYSGLKNVLYPFTSLFLRACIGKTLLFLAGKDCAGRYHKERCEALFSCFWVLWMWWLRFHIFSTFSASMRSA